MYIHISIPIIDIGIISYTAPQLLAPPSAVVPYRLPVVSSTTALKGDPPSAPPVKLYSVLKVTAAGCAAPGVPACAAAVIKAAMVNASGILTSRRRVANDCSVLVICSSLEPTGARRRADVTGRLLADSRGVGRS